MKTFLQVGLLCAGVVAGRAEWGPVSVSAGLGMDEAFSSHDRHAVYGLELAFQDLGGGFAPVVEAMVSGQNWVFVGAGLAWTRENVSGLGLRVAVAPGGYDRGDGKDLGGHFQILSFVEGTWRVAERGRLGLRLAHLSNASLRGSNPGTEILSLTYSVDWR